MISWLEKPHPLNPKVHQFYCALLLFIIVYYCLLSYCSLFIIIVYYCPPWPSEFCKLFDNIHHHWSASNVYVTQKNIGSIIVVIIIIINIINIVIFIIILLLLTSSTAQGGGGSFKNKKPIGEVGCCESGMAERSHCWIERCLISLTLSLSFSDYLPTYLSIFYVSIYLSI